MKRTSLFVTLVLLGSVAAGAASAVVVPRPRPDAAPATSPGETIGKRSDDAGAGGRSGEDTREAERICLLAMGDDTREVAFHDSGRDWKAGIELPDGEASVTWSCDIAYGDAWHCHADIVGARHLLHAALGADLCAAAQGAITDPRALPG